jgi:hypothetical protein
MSTVTSIFRFSRNASNGKNCLHEAWNSEKELRMGVASHASEDISHKLPFFYICAYSTAKVAQIKKRSSPNLW